MRLTTSRVAALVGGAALIAGTLGAAPAQAATSTLNFTNFCTASSIVTVTKVVGAGVTITAPESVTPGQQFTYRVQPIAGSYPNSDSGATTTNISRLKADFAIPSNATFVSAEVVPGTAVGLDNVAPNVLRVNDSGAVDPAGSVLRLSGNNQVIANGTSNSTNSDGGIRVPKTKKNLDGSNNANGDTWYRLPAVDVTMTAGASGTITPTVRIAGAAGNNNTDQNWSTQLAKASLFGTQWAPTRCSPRDAAGSGLNAGGGPLATIQIEAAAPVDEDTTTTVSAPGTATKGSAVTLSASVSPNPGGGTVQFKVDGAAVGAPQAVTGGNASIQHTFATTGAHQVSAVFSGAAGFNGSTSGTKTVTVSDQTPTEQDTDTTVTTPGTAFTGDAVTLSASVSPAPVGGTVQFKVDGANVGAPAAVTGGIATVQHTFATAGNRQVTAVYSGAPGFTGSTSPAKTIVVSTPDPADEETTISVSAPANVDKGAQVEIKATLTPATLNGGKVQFQVDGANVGAPVTVVNGQAAVQVTFASSGNHTVTATYAGTEGYAGSTSGPKIVTVAGGDDGGTDGGGSLDFGSLNTSAADVVRSMF